MIFILNPNPTSLSFWESWSFNMVSKLGLAGGLGFEPKTLFGSLGVGMAPYVREGVRRVGHLTLGKCEDYNK